MLHNVWLCREFDNTPRIAGVIKRRQHHGTRCPYMGTVRLDPCHSTQLFLPLFTVALFSLSRTLLLTELSETLRGLDEDEKIPINQRKPTSSSYDVDTRWLVPVVAGLTTLVTAGCLTNAGFFYVAFMEEFDISRESASWPSSALACCSAVAGKSNPRLWRLRVVTHT